MKKILFAAFQLLMLLLATSCSNDPIEIDTVGPKYSLTINVGTQGMYDRFGITSYVRENYLRDNSRSIGVFVYVYNEEGNLVENKLATLANFNTTAFSFDALIEGKYTVVTVETLLNPDVNNESDVWSIDNSEQLSTLKITQKLDEPDENGYRWTILAYAGNAVGVDIQVITLTSNTVKEIEPSPIGSVVNFHAYNFGNTSYPYVAYTTQDILDYYSLDPAISRDKKYSKNLTASGKTNVRAWHDSVEDEGTYTLTYILERDFEWHPCVQTHENVENGSVIVLNSLGSKETLEDGETYEIGFYYLGNDNVSSYFGDKAGLQEWVNDCEKNTISDNIFSVPYTNWNVGTVSAVKSYMSDFYLYQDVQWDEVYEGYSITFFDNLFNMYDYVFTSSVSGLTDAYVWVDDAFTLDQVREEVAKQGYTYHSQNGNNYYFTGSSTYVTVYQTSSGSIYVNYYNPKAYGLAPKRDIPKSEIEFRTKSRNAPPVRLSLSSLKKAELIAPFVAKKAMGQKRLSQ